MISSRLVGMPPGGKAGAFLPPTTPGSSVPLHAPPPGSAGGSRREPEGAGGSRTEPDRPRDGHRGRTTGERRGHGSPPPVRPRSGPVPPRPGSVRQSPGRAPGASVAACRMPRHRGCAFFPAGRGRRWSSPRPAPATGLPGSEISRAFAQLPIHGAVGYNPAARPVLSSDSALASGHACGARFPRCSSAMLCGLLRRCGRPMDPRAGRPEDGCAVGSGRESAPPPGMRVVFFSTVPRARACWTAR